MPFSKLSSHLRQLPWQGHLALLGSLLLASSTAACVYRTPQAHVPVAIPAFSAIDVEGSTTEVTTAEGLALKPDADQKIRRDLAEALAAAGKRRGASDEQAAQAGERGKARFHAHVHIQEEIPWDAAINKDGIAVVSLIAFPFGIINTRERLTVDVTVESGGWAFTGHGAADKFGSLYSPALKRALAVALDQALADASAHGGERLAAPEGQGGAPLQQKPPDWKVQGIAGGGKGSLLKARGAGSLGGNRGPSPTVRTPESPRRELPSASALP